MARIPALLSTLTTVALLTAAPVSADPIAPQADYPCPATLTGAFTMPAGASLPLVCEGLRWSVVTAPADPGDRWVSFGPPMALHGEGLRNPNLVAGSWTATPLDPDTRCAATQQPVISAGVVGPESVSEGPVGQPLLFDVVPLLFDIEMTGHCVWERTP